MTSPCRSWGGNRRSPVPGNFSITLPILVASTVFSLSVGSLGPPSPLCLPRQGEHGAMSPELVSLRTGVGTPAPPPTARRRVLRRAVPRGLLGFLQGDPAQLTQALPCWTTNPSPALAAPGLIPGTASRVNLPFCLGTCCWGTRGTQPSLCDPKAQHASSSNTVESQASGLSTCA